MMELLSIMTPPIGNQINPRLTTSGSRPLRYRPPLPQHISSTLVALFAYDGPDEIYVPHRVGRIPGGTTWRWDPDVFGLVDVDVDRCIFPGTARRLLSEGLAHAV